MRKLDQEQWNAPHDNGPMAKYTRAMKPLYLHPYTKAVKEAYCSNSIIMMIVCINGVIVSLTLQLFVAIIYFQTFLQFFKIFEFSQSEMSLFAYVTYLNLFVISGKRKNVCIYAHCTACIMEDSFQWLPFFFPQSLVQILDNVIFMEWKFHFKFFFVSYGVLPQNQLKTKTNGWTAITSVFLLLRDWSRRLAFWLLLFMRCNNESNDVKRQKSAIFVCNLHWYFPTDRKCLYGNKWHFRCIFGKQR